MFYLNEMKIIPGPNVASEPSCWSSMCEMYHHPPNLMQLKEIAGAPIIFIYNKPRQKTITVDNTLELRHWGFILHKNLGRLLKFETKKE